MGLLASRTINAGGAVMRKPDLMDYVIASPFALPFWLWGYLYMFITVSPGGWLVMMIPLLFFVIWLRQWTQSLTTILEAQSVKSCEEERKEVFPCIQPSNI
jgi:hypothetical protein